MINSNRRQFFKISAALTAGLAVTSTSELKAKPENILSPDRMGVLVDTTVCVGCRNCEWACKNAHNFNAGDIDSYKDRSVFQKKRRPDCTSLTVVNEFKNMKFRALPIDVKVQCMHCDKPACVSACIVGAFSKQKDGRVIWDGGKCIGCRYCMVACPFQVPTFEYEKTIEPKICKCDLCDERQNADQLPACIDICPVEALTFGERADLIKIARNRIKRNPDRYVNYIYGENEVGGTGWMYLSSKKFEELDFPKLHDKTAPGVSEAIQHGIFAYFVPPAMLYALLGSMMWVTKKRQNKDKEVEDGSNS